MAVIAPGLAARRYGRPVGSTTLNGQQRLDYLMQVGHALNLVCELPEWLERAALAKHLGHAAAESFAMNSRVLVEFLWSTANYDKDIRARDYCARRWLTGEKPAALSTLGDKHVAHMTAARLDDPLIQLTYGERVGIRDQLLATASKFAAAIDDPRCRDTMAGYVKHARKLASWPPPPTDRDDPGPFIDAIAGLRRRSSSG